MRRGCILSSRTSARLIRQNLFLIIFNCSNDKRMPNMRLTPSAPLWIEAGANADILALDIMVEKSSSRGKCRTSLDFRSPSPHTKSRRAYCGSLDDVKPYESHLVTMGILRSVEKGCLPLDLLRELGWNQGWIYVLSYRYSKPPNTEN